MIAPAALFVLLALFAAEAVYLWVGQLHRIRAEAAYWHAVENRPELYDWERDL